MKVKKETFYSVNYNISLKSKTPETESKMCDY